MADGFLGRWARRKEAVRQGKEVPPEPEKVVVPEVPPPQPSAKGGGSPPGSSPPLPGEGQGGGAAAPVPPPTLEEARSLTNDADFTRFVRPGVDPQVKNTALKKLFADPHFNVMDGLDVYIDDYGKPDPMPPGMLEQLASTQFLRRFHEEEEAREKARAAEAEARAADDTEISATESANPEEPAPESVAQSGSRTEQALPPAEDHADPDLRLQQDDAPGRESPGAGSG